MENLLRKAVERDELDLHYQPQYRLGDGAVFGVEALLRWNNQELGPLAPTEFIPVAEESPLILSIGEWVLRKACQQAKVWLSQGISLHHVAVNVSVIQLLHKGFCSMVAKVLDETGLPPRALQLELTESALISDEAHMLKTLESLSQMGVLLAIDDFGTGYSSLNRLMKFPIDCLKIDQSFIGAIEDNGVPRRNNRGDCYHE